jgi:hypothetical protein
LNRSKRVWNIILVCGIAGAGFTGCSRQPEQPKPAAETISATPSAQFKDIWVSETTGKVYRATLVGDVFRAECVNLSPDLTAHGAFIRTECKRQGTKWVGASTSYLPWKVGTGAKTEGVNWCHLETTFEIDSIAPDRITGKGESVKKIDIKNCKILESGTAGFFWSPKK